MKILNKIISIAVIAIYLSEAIFLHTDINAAELMRRDKLAKESIFNDVGFTTAVDDSAKDNLGPERMMDQVKSTAERLIEFVLEIEQAVLLSCRIFLHVLTNRYNIIAYFFAAMLFLNVFALGDVSAQSAEADIGPKIGYAQGDTDPVVILQSPEYDIFIKANAVNKLLGLGVSLKDILLYLDPERDQMLVDIVVNLLDATAEEDSVIKIGLHADVVAFSESSPYRDGLGLAGYGLGDVLVTVGTKNGNVLELKTGVVPHSDLLDGRFFVIRGDISDISRGGNSGIWLRPSLAYIGGDLPAVLFRTKAGAFYEGIFLDANLDLDRSINPGINSFLAYGTAGVRAQGLFAEDLRLTGALGFPWYYAGNEFGIAVIPALATKLSYKDIFDFNLLLSVPRIIVGPQAGTIFDYNFGVKTSAVLSYMGFLLAVGFDASIYFYDQKQMGYSIIMPWMQAGCDITDWLRFSVRTGLEKDMTIINAPFVPAKIDENLALRASGTNLHGDVSLVLDVGKLLGIEEFSGIEPSVEFGLGAWAAGRSQRDGAGVSTIQGENIFPKGILYLGSEQYGFAIVPVQGQGVQFMFTDKNGREYRYMSTHFASAITYLLRDTGIFYPARIGVITENGAGDSTMPIGELRRINRAIDDSFGGMERALRWQDKALDFEPFDSQAVVDGPEGIIQNAPIMIYILKKAEEYDEEIREYFKSLEQSGNTVRFSGLEFTKSFVVRILGKFYIIKLSYSKGKVQRITVDEYRAKKVSFDKKQSDRAV